MKKKQIKEIRTKNIKELAVIKAKTESELVQLQSDLGSGKLKDVQRVKRKKRELAQIKTIIREKKLLEPEKEENLETKT